MTEPSVDEVAELFDALPIGIIVLDERARVVVYNRREAALAGRSREQVIGRDFFREVAPCTNVRALAGEFEARIGRERFDTSIELAFPFPWLERPREVVLRMRSFEVNRRPHACISLDDVGAERSVARLRTLLGALVVHDLKNPLAAIHLTLDSLRRRAGDGDAADLLSGALVESERLQRMLLTLLDVTRLETMTMPLRRARVEVSDLVTAAVATASPRAILEGVSVSVDAPDEPLILDGDGELLRRALDNLLDNALRFARTDVVVRARRAGEYARVEIWNDGPSISREAADAVFEPFVTSGASRGDNQGLGLTLVRLVVIAHGGHVSVRVPERGGTCFEVVMPLEGRPVPAFAEPRVQGL